MASEREFKKLQPLPVDQLWTAVSVGSERAQWEHPEGVIHELSALPEYLLDPSQSRFSRGEQMRWLFRAVVGAQVLEADNRYDDRIKEARDLERNLRAQDDAALAVEASRLWDRISAARGRRYAVNVRELGKLIGERQFFVGFGGASDQSATGQFYVAKLEDIAAVQTTLGRRVPQMVVAGRDGRRGSRPEGLRVRRFIYEELE